jgi:hypothetical protein
MEVENEITLRKDSGNNSLAVEKRLCRALLASCSHSFRVNSLDLAVDDFHLDANTSKQSYHQTKQQSDKNIILIVQLFKSLDHMEPK